MNGPLTRRRKLTAHEAEDEHRELQPSQRIRIRDAARRADARRRDRLTAEGRRILAEYMGDDDDPVDVMRRLMSDLAQGRRPDVPDTPRNVGQRMAQDIGER